MKPIEIYNIKIIHPWAITLYPFIIYGYSKQELPETLRRHEWEHVKQIKDIGLLKFFVKYTYELLYNIVKKRMKVSEAYYNISFEIEAYKNQADGLKPWEGKNE